MLFIGKRCFDRFNGELRGLGYDPIPLSALSDLGAVVCDHADTLIFKCGRRCLTSEKTLMSLPPEVRDRFSVSSDAPHGKYPKDVCFNALEVDGRLFARLESLSSDAKRIADGCGLKMVNVRQGYAACSALRVAASVATADRGLYAALKSEGIDALLIQAGGISLEGCEYGFIGGASFCDDEKRRVVFFGRLPDEYSSTLISFCSERGYEPIELSGELTDLGGGVLL